MPEAELADKAQGAGPDEDLVSDTSSGSSDSSDSSDDDDDDIAAGFGLGLGLAPADADKPVPKPKAQAKPKPRATKAKPKAGKAAAKPKAKAAAKPKAEPKQKLPLRKRARVASPSVEAEAEAEAEADGTASNGACADGTSYNPQDEPVLHASQILRTELRHLDDIALKVLAEKIVSSSGAERRVVVISSTNLSPVLTRWWTGDLDPQKKDMFKMLGVTRDEIANAEAIIITIHGPLTSQELSACQLYGDAKVNSHWSALCYFRGASDLYHYDSAGAINQNRAQEAAGVLIKAGVLDQSLRGKKVLVPEFFPHQTTSWECGHFFLLAVKIIADRHPAGCITANDVDDTYRLFVDTMQNGPRSLFTSTLMRMLVASLYT